MLPLRFYTDYFEFICVFHIRSIYKENDQLADAEMMETTIDKKDSKF